MTNEDASAIAALNQTLRHLVETLRELNTTLDKLGYPRPKEDQGG